MYGNTWLNLSKSKLMDNFFKKFEKYVSFILMALAMMFVCYQVLELVYHFSIKLTRSIQYATFDIEEKGKPVASTFFSILLLLEIIQTIRVFSSDHAIKLKIILIVGLIAVTRKILEFGVHDASPADEFATAALIIALSAGYYLVNKSEKPKQE
jgi:uncharacterized membrane protein (DUF373 family)